MVNQQLFKELSRSATMGRHIAIHSGRFIWLVPSKSAFMKNETDNIQKGCLLILARKQL
jgi:hypothetical protein